MGSKAKTICLKAYIDKKKNKVMFAEADEDFVEILFSFLTLPLGTIARLSSQHADSNNIQIGSLNSLYQSFVNLDDLHFSNEICKDALVNPRNSSANLCQKLKLNLDETNGCIKESNGNTVLLKKKGSFIVTDDLKVTPFLVDKYIELLNTIGYEYVDFVEKTVHVDFEKFANLLKWSLLTNNPITNLVLGGSRNDFLTSSCSLCNTNATLDTTSHHIMVKLVVHKSTKKVICAHVDNQFVEMLFSFLTIPLGTFIHLNNNSSSFGINNVYKSISTLRDEKYLQSNDIKTMLLRPKVASNYHRVTDLLPIYEKDINAGSFLKEQATFLVSDDLEVTPSPSVSTISKFFSGIHVGDLEVLQVGIGEHEARLILQSSLMSTSVLTDCLDAFINKMESST